MVDVPKLYESCSFEKTGFDREDFGASDVLGEVLHKSGQRKRLVEEALVNECLSGHGKSMEQFTWLEDILICKEITSHEFTESITCIFTSYLWMGHAQLSWSSE